MSIIIPMLIEAAYDIVGRFPLEGSSGAGCVASALITKEHGEVFTGIALDMHCGIGFCAEHAAIAEMLKHREAVIDMIVALSPSKIMTPCGRCRELMVQVSEENFKTQIIVGPTEIVLLEDLLPMHWKQTCEPEIQVSH